MIERKCSSCSGSFVDEGKLTYPTQVFYASETRKPSFWSWAGNKFVVNRATVCLSCGLVEMRMDPDDLRRLMS